MFTKKVWYTVYILQILTIFFNNLKGVGEMELYFPFLAKIPENLTNWNKDIGELLQVLGLSPIYHTDMECTFFSPDDTITKLSIQTRCMQYVYTIVFEESTAYLVLLEKNYYIGSQLSLSIQIERYHPERKALQNVQIEHFGTLPYSIQKEYLSLEALQEIESILWTENIGNWTMQQFVQRFGKIRV